MRLWHSALVLALLVLAMHHPLLSGGLLGEAGTDVFRAVWGFDHQARGLPLPFWTERVGFPAGVKLVILPFVSTLLGAPFHLFFGPWMGYNLWMLALVVAGGVTTAWWVGEASRSPSAGLLAGVAMVTQPSLLLALTDGTPEHVAFWSLPALLAALWQTSRSPLRRWPVVGGVLATVVALDSPYHAVFSVPLVLGLLWRCTWRGRGRFVGTAVVGVLLVGVLYYKLPLAGPVDNRWDNAAKLSVWAQWDLRRVATAWDYTYTPAFIPVLSMLAAVGLAFLRPSRSWPWLVAAAGFLGLALGGNQENVAVLGDWIPGVGESVGDAVVAVNNALAPSSIRFPRRWLVPAALALWTAAGLGLSRLPAEWMRLFAAVPVASGLVWLTLDRTGYHEAFPKLEVPAPAFAAFVHDHELDGAALVLPTVRGASRKHERFELPIFAELDDSIRSADGPFLQVALGRPLVNAPQGLFTLVARSRQADEVARLVQDLNDLCTPQTMGTAIAPSALQEPARRAAAARYLVERGLRFVVLDEALYGTEGLKWARLPFTDHLVEERRFDDGSGVSVFVLGP